MGYREVEVPFCPFSVIKSFLLTTRKMAELMGYKTALVGNTLSLESESQRYKTTINLGDISYAVMAQERRTYGIRDLRNTVWGLKLDIEF